jgi:hypothetical protein
LKKNGIYFDLLSNSLLSYSFFSNYEFSNREEGSIIKSMGGANLDSTNGIKNRVLLK